MEGQEQKKWFGIVNPMIFFFHIPQIQLLCDSNSMASLLARA